MLVFQKIRRAGFLKPPFSDSPSCHITNDLHKVDSFLFFLSGFITDIFPRGPQCLPIHFFYIE